MKLTVTAALMIVACVYISTACPTIYIGDSGETCATGFTLGIGHPPGYPVYTLISKIFTLIPLGDAAFRVNLLAACSGVIAVLFIFLLAIEFIVFTGAKEKFVWIPALIVALGFAFSGTFWFEALHAKGGIYTLAVMAVSAAFYYVLKFYNTGRKKFMYMAIYLAGFLPLIHLTASLVMLFVVYIICIRIRKFKKKDMPIAGVIVITALFTPVLYLIIRAFSEAVIRWADVNSMAGVIGLMLRKTYYTPMDMPFSLHAVFFKLWNHMIQYAKDYVLFLPFAIYGFYRVFKTNIKLFYITAGFIAVNTAAIVILTGNSFSPVYLYVNKGFYLISDMGSMTFAALGIYALVCGMKKYINPVLASGVLMAIAAYMLGVNYSILNLSSSFIAYDYAVNIEKTLKPGDTFLCGADTPVFNIAYMKYVKNRFKDISIYDANANLFDLKPYEHFRGKMTDAQLKTINAEIASSNPGRVYSSEFLAYPSYNLRPDTYGIINRLVGMDIQRLGISNISDFYTVRDYMNSRHADIACREIIARYFIAKAQLKGLKGDQIGR